MSSYYFSSSTDVSESLIVAPLTERRIAMSGQTVDDASGYFLFATRGEGDAAEVEIIAQLLSEEAALRLRDLLGME